MQLQNHLFNFSEEEKKSITDNDNKINSINFQNSLNEKENKNNIKLKEIENDNKNKFKLNNINIININENIENSHFSNTNKSPFIFPESEPKSDKVKNLDNNHSAFNPTDKSNKIDLGNSKDKNFFNYLFYNNILYFSNMIYIIMIIYN